MKQRLILIAIISTISQNGIAQIRTVGPFYFSCNDQLFSIDFGAWTDPIQYCDKFNYDFYSNTENFDKIPSQDSLIIDKIKYSIKARGGKEFYNRLVLQDIIISKRPKKCEGRKYTLRFIFPLDTIFYYRFSLTYNIEGNLISDPMFPDVSSNLNILSFINYCQAIEIALSDSIFKKSYINSGLIKSIEDERTGEQLILGDLALMSLCYDKKLNCWTWELFTESVFEGDKGDTRCLTGTWIGKKITINAHDKTILNVEDYKEFKSVTYER